MKLSPDEIADCQTDLLSYVKFMFRARKGQDLLENWHQSVICDALERVVIGMCPRLIINVPPRSGKTELAVINFISWCMGVFPSSEFIHSSYSKRLATYNTYNIRSIMLSDAYRNIFTGVSIKQDSTAKDEFRTNQGGVVYATGAEGTITGYGAGGLGEHFNGCVIVDDPHKAGEANSQTMRENVVDWFQTTMESRKNNPDTPIIVIMQRLHEQDLSGWLLGGGNGESWEHIKIPAMYEGDKSFWPVQFPVDDLKRKEASNTYVFAGQYMQEPSPIGGGIFKEKWWQFYIALPKIQYRMIYADTAQKTKEQNDFTVFECWGKGNDGRIYLLDMIREKWESPQLLVQAKAFWQKHRAMTDKSLGTLRKMKIEDKVSGTGLIQQLQQGKDRIPVEGIPRDKDKITRAFDVAPQIEVGNVVLPESHPCLSDFLTEARTFPNGAHDDTLDPMMDAIEDMLLDGRFSDYRKII